MCCVCAVFVFVFVRVRLLLRVCVCDCAWQVWLLVENMGRLNYGRGMTDPKGILAGDVTWTVTGVGEPVNVTYIVSSLPLTVRYSQCRFLWYLLCWCWCWCWCWCGAVGFADIGG